MEKTKKYFIVSPIYHELNNCGPHVHKCNIIKDHTASYVVSGPNCPLCGESLEYDEELILQKKKDGKVMITNFKTGKYCPCCGNQDCDLFKIVKTLV